MPLNPAAFSAVSIGLIAAPLTFSANAGAQPSPAASPQALVAEARQYEHGEGVTRDVQRSVALYCEAAKAGDAEAQFSLGWIYANGRGVERNDAIAANFFRHAMRGGHPNAHRMVSLMGERTALTPACMLDTGTSVVATEKPGRTGNKPELALKLSPTLQIARN